MQASGVRFPAVTCLSANILRKYATLYKCVHVLRPGFESTGLPPCEEYFEPNPALQVLYLYIFIFTKCPDDKVGVKDTVLCREY
jgi:hypothetical protein